MLALLAGGGGADNGDGHRRGCLQEGLINNTGRWRWGSFSSLARDVMTNELSGGTANTLARVQHVWWVRNWKEKDLKTFFYEVSYGILFHTHRSPKTGHLVTKHLWTNHVFRQLVLVLNAWKKCIKRTFLCSAPFNTVEISFTVKENKLQYLKCLKSWLS